ncbi:hypothetical protein Cs7R123_63260 [Catellatospora sp. TT07R-123]|uniref:helix-turn-helix transcriptional regulator n=1 Tax=Catellatospora sp. TT07R-123 TaxID=2733863 RepID=UPI001B08138A|nr:helix-turn-helix transcriptional regulator [Catellatospora sp. TT07R-123]GHJ48984.1 hypothetical protein Cs7R123_63260 [Catellatospora sp. TT07R-123]
MDLRRRRIAAGLSLIQLAELTGYDRTYISKVERGLSTGSSEMRRRCLAAVDEHQSQQYTPVVVIPDDNMPSRAPLPLPYQTFGSELQRLRKAAGLTLRQLAVRIPCDPGSLSNYEHGRRIPSRDIARHCDRLLAADGALVALLDPVPHDAAREDEQAWVMGVDVSGRGWFTEIDRRTALRTSAALGVSRWFDGPVTAAQTDVTELTSLFSTIRAMCQQVSPELALPVLVSKTNGIRRIAETVGSRRPTELLTVASHYAIYTGKMFQEAGDFAAAGRWTTQARSWALRCESPGLMAYVLARQALLTFYAAGPAEEIIGLARSAQSLPGVSSRTLGLAALREALGHARAGDETACRHALERAGQLLRVAAGEPAEDLAGLEASTVTDHVAITTAYCLYLLGRPSRAASMLEVQRAALPVQARRAHLYFGARQALAHAAANEIDQACALTWRLLPAVADTASATALRDLRALVRVLNRHRRHAAVSHLLTEMNHILTTDVRRPM